MNTEQVIKNIRNEFKTYMKNTDRKSVVLGVSGGIDSALIAVLVKPVCDEIGIKLLGYSLPTNTNKPDEINRANNIGNYFCTKFSVQYIEKFVNSFVEEDDTYTEFMILDNDKDKKVAQGNIKARTRMILLYNHAFCNKGLVLSTDNLTEYQLGFSTIMGDWGDLGLIQYLWKTEVYQLSQWIVDNELKTGEEKKALQDCINAIPTDGLGITNSDLDQIGVSTYKEVDDILKSYLENKIGDINNPVIQRHIKSQFKRNWPITLKREVLFK